MPKKLAYIFSLFKELRFSRTPPNNLQPRSALTFADLNAYQQLTNFNLSSLEIDTILSIDAIFNKASE